MTSRATRGGELTGEDCGEVSADTWYWPSRMKKSAELNQVNQVNFLLYPPPITCGITKTGTHPLVAVSTVLTVTMTTVGVRTVLTLVPQGTVTCIPCHHTLSSRCTVSTILTRLRICTHVDFCLTIFT